MLILKNYLNLSVDEITEATHIPYYKVGNILSGNGKRYFISKIKLYIFFTYKLYVMYRKNY